ncbi:hypothetical protein EYF80_046815 [Liparis tanakae]|uniref:Uncharacterized protein n=1 Tax=Liparis tanakae TaxID=230148 RepID=A0A4Z2FQK0_9TELE|nr:hypothetical protein EYF80_046815 [Liparis tanakae]
MSRLYRWPGAAEVAATAAEAGREASKDEDGVGGNHQRYEMIRRGDGGVARGAGRQSAGQVRVEEVVSWFGYGSGSCGKGKGVV